jgi:threonine aldolase
MNRISRRKFVKSSAAATMFKFSNNNLFSSAGSDQNDKIVLEKNIHLTSDGLNLTPLEYSRLLARMAEEKKIEADYYSLGGSVETLEREFARLLGKESAIFIPTGTLANHMAIRALSNGRNRVIVQGESHIYNDSGDCIQTLSNLNLIPVGNGRADFTLKEVKEVMERTASGRVSTRIGVISIETPVRRRAGEMFNIDEMKRISNFARENDINLHLDGARLFIASAYTGITPAEYAALFDTVYISLYKYFNAASGAILAGPKRIIENMFHTRRMFGSGLPEAWPYAVVALLYLDRFIEKFKEAIKVSEDLIKRLKALPRIEIERIPSGTNVFKLKVEGMESDLYRERLRNRGILIRTAEKDSNQFSLFVNESLNFISGSELSEIFIQSLT